MGIPRKQPLFCGGGVEELLGHWDWGRHTGLSRPYADIQVILLLSTPSRTPGFMGHWSLWWEPASFLWVFSLQAMRVQIPLFVLCFGQRFGGYCGPQTLHPDDFRATLDSPVHIACVPYEAWPQPFWTPLPRGLSEPLVWKQTRNGIIFTVLEAALHGWGESHEYMLSLLWSHSALFPNKLPKDLIPQLCT